VWTVRDRKRLHSTSILSNPSCAGFLPSGWRGEDRMVAGISRSPSTWAFLASAIHTHPQFESPGGADVVLLGNPRDLSVLKVMPRTWRFLRALALSPDGTRLAVR
jgi:hypothetical protein